MVLKENFDHLFYKIREPVLPKGKLPPNWGAATTHESQSEDFNPLNFKLVDHPADNQVDYNSIIDFLEEEHMRREVFTTAIEPRGGHLSDNPSVSIEASIVTNNNDGATPVGAIDK